MEFNEPNFGLYCKYPAPNASARGNKILQNRVNQETLQPDTHYQIRREDSSICRKSGKSLLNNNVSCSSGQNLNPPDVSTVWIPESINAFDKEDKINLEEDPLGQTSNAIIDGSDSSLCLRRNQKQTSTPSVIVQREQRVENQIEMRRSVQENSHTADSSNTSQNVSSSLSSSDNESENSDDEYSQPSKNMENPSANWKEFLSGLRSGHYGMSDTYRHHLDPDAPLLLPEDYGQSDVESESSTERVAKPSKKSKVVEAKEALNKGQEHINVKGKLIRARRMGEGCGKKSCRFKCSQRITQEARTNIFNYFWNLGNHQLQWLFIAMHTTVRTPKQRTQAPEVSRRKTSRSYYFRQGTGKIPVCKTMFLETLDVSDSWVDTAIAKAANGVAVAPDCRGRHSKATGRSSEKKKEPRAKKRRSRKDRIRACPPSALPEDSEKSCPPGNSQQIDHLPLQNIENRCEKDSEMIKSPDVQEPYGTQIKLPAELSESNFVEENLDSTRDSNDSSDHSVCDINRRGEVDSTLLSPRVDLRTASDVSESSDGVVTWGEAAAKSELAVLGGILGAVAIPEAFRHHLDPETLCLRQLPNGAVLNLEEELLDEVRPTPPKRRRVPSRWRANLCKEALNTGKEHVNMKGKLIRARRMREGCDDLCRFRCKERLQLSAREDIFQYFWSLGDHQLQWLFIGQHTRVREPKQRTLAAGLSRRKTSRSYFFTVGQQEVAVCKTMFLHTLDVSDSWVESAILKVAAGDVAVVADLRGRHRKVARRVPEAVGQSVREHARLFPRPIKRKRGKSVSNHYHMYLDWMEQEGRTGQEVATLRQYRDILAAERKAAAPNPASD